MRRPFGGRVNTWLADQAPMDRSRAVDLQPKVDISRIKGKENVPQNVWWQRVVARSEEWIATGGPAWA